MKYLKDIKDWKELINEVVCGDCLELMPLIADKSIDMILCDLPYGTTACKWDTIIPFEPLWKEYKRIIKDNGAIVLTASQPFTSALVMSNPKMFKYELIWHKNSSASFATAKKIPMKYHENICIFYNKLPIYNPIFQEYSDSTKKRFKDGEMCNRKKQLINSTNLIQNGLSFEGEQGIMINRGKYPESIIRINNQSNNKRVHPTQKPIALFEYLIKTYTNEGDLVLDNCAGSFTTAIACNNLKRKWICMEKESNYAQIGEERLRQELLF